ncbi:MAG: 30S ribosomal protein S6 [Bdellovibrionales bacterium]|nr:30S ribosomal protein S6 [Bdellovibrionales bacterium]
MANFRKDSLEYQAVIIFDSELSEEAVKEEIAKIEATISAHSGSVVSNQLWGRRQLAYPIQKKQYGIYVVIDFNADNNLVSDLNRQLKINDNCLRVLIVERDEFAPPLSTKLREQAAPLQGERGSRDSRSSSDDDSDDIPQDDDDIDDDDQSADAQA